MDSPGRLMIKEINRNYFLNAHHATLFVNVMFKMLILKDVLYYFDIEYGTITIHLFIYLKFFLTFLTNLLTL